jgi:hypothetical protein
MSLSLQRGVQTTLEAAAAALAAAITVAANQFRDAVVI